MSQVFECVREEVDDNITITVLEINELTGPLKAYIDDNLVAICEGTYSDSSLDMVKKRVQSLFRGKNSKSDDDYTNWEMGAVAEFFIHLYIKSIGLTQDCMFLNLEERSIKKGFDGFYSNLDDRWVMESKSGSIKTHGITHVSKIKEAISDLKSKFSGGVKNDPWRNAYNHASQTDVKSADKVTKYLKQLSEDFLQEKVHDISEFNIIPCGTIYYEDVGFSKKEDIASQAKDAMSAEARKTHVVCVSSKSVGIFKEYIGI